jgi:hypothetical protein
MPKEDFDDALAEATRRAEVAEAQAMRAEAARRDAEERATKAESPGQDQLPQTEREWQLALLAGQRAVQMDPDQWTGPFQQLQSQYQAWKTLHEENTRTSQRARDRFELKLDAAGIEGDSHVRRLAMAGFDAGIPVDELEEQYLTPLREQAAGEAAGTARRATSERAAKATEIESGETRTAPDDEETDKPTPDQSLSIAAAKSLMGREPAFTSIFRKTAE